MSDVIKKVKSVIKEFESDYFKLEQSLKKQNQNEVQKIITKLNKRKDELDNILDNLIRKKNTLKKNLNAIKEKSEDKENELNEIIDGEFKRKLKLIGKPYKKKYKDDWFKKARQVFDDEDEDYDMEDYFDVILSKIGKDKSRKKISLKTLLWAEKLEDSNEDIWTNPVYDTFENKDVMSVGDGNYILIWDEDKEEFKEMEYNDDNDEYGFDNQSRYIYGADKGQEGYINYDDYNNMLEKYKLKNPSVKIPTQINQMLVSGLLPIIDEDEDEIENRGLGNDFKL